LTPSTLRDAVTPQRVGQIIWRRKLVSLAVAAVILAGGAGWLVTQPKVYQSTAEVALLPVTTNSGVLPNYPNLVASLLPTYVQLISSPVLLDRVAATVPFQISAAQLATQVHGESLSSAAVISIVADNTNPVRAQEIAAAATTAFLARLHGNGVVVPQVFGRPAVSDKPAFPDVKLVLAVLVVLALVCGAAAGLARDRLAGPAPAAAPRADDPPPSLTRTGLPAQADASPPLLALDDLPQARDSSPQARDELLPHGPERPVAS
jgi:capsular polysaccharide biosynthesis protein